MGMGPGEEREVVTKLTTRINRSQANRGAAIATMALTMTLACASGTSPGARVQSADEGPPSSRVLLRGMTDYLRAQQAFSFRIVTSFEIFDSGQKLQFAGSADLRVRRPDRLAIDYRDDLSAKRIWYDGSQLTLFDPEANVYASTEAQSNLDDTLDQLERHYGLVMPTSDLLGDDAYALIASRATGASYVGLHEVAGTACHHLAFVGEEVDLQLWIRDGDSPAPCKYVVDYKEEPGRPEYVVVMLDWEFGKKLADSHFEPVIPEDARKIEFLEIEESRR